MHSCYGRHRTNVMLHKHIHDGSKNIQDIFPYGEKSQDKLFYDTEFLTYNAMVLHDQEPFSRSYLNTYKEQWVRSNNYPDTWARMQDHELLLYKIRSCSWPIFCHSEKNSDDIKWVEEHGMIGCHYLWHGLIARDWFRHWKHHPDLLETSDSWNQRFLLYAREKTGTRQYRENLINALRPIKEDIRHDWEEKQSIPSSNSAIIDVDDSRSTAVHLVAETIFDQNKIHATEKMFKPMVMSQPFIAFAGAGMLEYMRSYGFKTFGDLWDESYDLETCHQTRFNKLIKLINDLHNLTDSEFRHLMQKTKEITKHNRQHFYSDRFESNMLSEIDDNVKTAIEKQRQLSVTDPGGGVFRVINSLHEQGIEFLTSMRSAISHFSKNPTNNPIIDRVKQQYPWIGQ